MAVQGGPGNVGAGELKRQRATFTLVPITLPQLGAFLDAWRQREPYWTVASIDVGPEPIRQNENGGAAAAGRDLPLRAVLTLEAIYLDEPKGDRR
jgi:hypothetical protein